jgi:chromosome segregation ATPase
VDNLQRDREIAVTPGASTPPPLLEIVKQSEELVTRLRILQEDVSAERKEKHDKLLELTRVHARLKELEDQLDKLHQAQIESTMNRQELLDERDQFRQMYESIRAAHQRLQSELVGIQEAAGQVRKSYDDLKQAHAEAGLLSARSLKAAFDDMSKVQEELRHTKEQLYRAEQVRIELTQKTETEQAALRDQLAATTAELGTMQVNHRHPLGERDELYQEGQATAARLARVELESARVRGQLTSDKTNLLREVEQLKHELEASITLAEQERDELIREIGRVQQERQQVETALARETTLRQAEQEDARQKNVELERIDKERIRLRDERASLLSKVDSLEQELKVRQASFDAENSQLRDQVAVASGELGTLRIAHRQLVGEHDNALQERAVAAAREHEHEQEAQLIHARLSEDKANLVAQVHDFEKQVQLLKGELEPLRSSWHGWQAERERLLADRDRLEHEAQAREAAFKAERKLRQSQFDEVRKQVSGVEKLKEERDQFQGERNALMAQLRTRDQEIKAKTATASAEQAKLRGQVAALMSELEGLRAAQVHRALDLENAGARRTSRVSVVSQSPTAAESRSPKARPRNGSGAGRRAETGDALLDEAEA